MVRITIREKLESTPISMNELEGVPEGAGREVGFQDGDCLSRFLKQERINNQTFITIQYS